MSGNWGCQHHALLPWARALASKLFLVACPLDDTSAYHCATIVHWKVQRTVWLLLLRALVPGALEGAGVERRLLSLQPQHMDLGVNVSCLVAS
eukprot:1160513-Pelagomonas_calceolata.AAC.7